MFLELKDTTFGHKEALISKANTSLALGEVCLLIGNNGVGKTTLLKSILNQIPLLKGEIYLKNSLLKTLSSKQIAAQIAMVFSKAQIPANYTVKDLVSLGKYLHYPYYFELTKEDDDEVERLIHDLNLQQYKNFSLQQLSDGNLQKTFIGRALAQNSPMIILDEPTTHLDEENKINILKLLRSLAKTHNKLILFSSHDWRLAKEFADKIWIIHNKNLETGIAEEILLKHNELLNGRLFQMDDAFVPPHISAPEMEKEMLYSFLQKNFKKNLSDLKFTFHSNIWEIESSEIHYKCTSFTDISNILSKHL
ncbi:ABC transporter [Chryseobacterium sp. 6424]|uniref:ABC transporter ATP-binding protein n=1 Tax=Chryseobacterium sp. 6424 TaxID=2039166 RepID=UPI000EFC8700|nr:ABC transporter ATP-binding protein [Chryseobacterium sp. 6424]AYO57889.1 ABC transporter [Chryseobacterium sp. 6424]